jgi:hypothetical protein
MSPVQWALRKWGDAEKDIEYETVGIQYGGRMARNARDLSAPRLSAGEDDGSIAARIV